ncbi:YfcE family phosphodiesterase [Effusibacillus lacus]|uniref:Phosphoesterase n=1 Tax=Effusibacillus lacus TaxID=1348429 RepID=A0A292YRM9_9BACL|nr:metallophosphoesterase [Effusibacillus lacus]TCS70051.1 hypothetical protein EDD64_13414 [Effusibacillus lacus]GAX91110.1 phosphodiesterase [Effusibacillus lacus]
MKICVMSDSHGRTDRIDNVLRRHKGIDLLLHAGDHAQDVLSRQDVRFRTVCGNCDPDGSASNEQVFELSGLKVFMTHGHLYKVKRTLLPITCRAKELNAELVIFGHSHVPVIAEEQGIVLLNPGSLSYSRGVVAQPSYGIMELHAGDAGKKVKIQLYSVTGEALPGFGFEHGFQ